MSYRFSLLGPPQLRRADGTLLDFPLGKPLALLSYLAVEGREVGRDELARLLWSDSPPDRARHSVRQAIWLIRKKLGEEVLVGDDPISVSWEALSLDLRDFQVALRAGSLDEARALWRGPFLSQLSLSECRAWEHWREDQRERVTQGFFRALMDRGRTLSEEGHWLEALPYLLEAIDLNPFSLEARTLQIECLLGVREISAAGQALEEARRETADGGEGQDPLDELELRLKEMGGRTSSQTPDRLGESPAFVGRREELTDLQGLWRRVLAGRVGVASILGPTGIGKTRLGEEFLLGVEESGGVVVRAKGYRGEHRIPWGVVADLVRELMTLPGAMGIGSGSETVLRGMLPSLPSGGEGGVREAGGSVAQRGDLTPAALADAVLDLVEAVGFEVPLAFFLDDWQWVDKESRALLGKVMRRVPGLPCLFLMAERTGERRISQEGAEDLTREAGGRVVFLKSLSLEEMADLLGFMAEPSDPARSGEVIQRFHRVTGGNPLFVGEILRKLAEDGIYRWEEGRWVLFLDEFPAELDLPESVQDLIRGRLLRLSSSGAQLAAALARERRSVPVGVLRRRSDLDEAVFTRAMGELLDREVLEWVGEKEVDFTHDQLREGARRFYRASGKKRYREWLRERPGLVAGAILMASLLFTLTAVQGPKLFPGGAPWGAGDLLAPPFGPGRILLLGDSILELIPPRRRGEPWEIRSSELERPPGATNRLDGPYRLPDGGVRWFGEIFGVEDPPYLAELLDGGEERVFFRGPGDDGFFDLAPDGATALLTTQNVEAPGYQRDLVSLPPGGGPPRVLYSPHEVPYEADWSPDGRLIVTSLSGVVDTLLVMDPLGRVKSRWVFPAFRHLQKPRWCGGGRWVHFQGLGPEPPRGVMLDTANESYFRFGRDLLAIVTPVCPGVDDAVVYVGVREDGRSVYVEDLADGTPTEILALSDFGPAELRWLPDRVPPPVWQVEIREDGLELEWSGQDSLGARVRRSDGSLEEVAVTWESLDPGVVSVSSQGVVTANSLGQTYVVAEAAGWVRDSIPVTVEEAREWPAEVLFRETFQEGDLRRWVIPDSTFPHPRVVSGERGNVLDFGGDGRYRDVIKSREVFSLQYGATLELEARLPLNRRDKQRFSVCLQEVRPGESGSGTEGEVEWVVVGRDFCVQHPVGMLSKYRDDLIFVRGAPYRVAHEVDATPHLPSDDWIHVALQVRPDGIGSVILNREVVFETSYVLTGHDTSLWTITLDGAGVDTELLFRDITLWRGARY